MKCPHCLDSFHDAWTQFNLGNDSQGGWLAKTTRCPACKRFVVNFQFFPNNAMSREWMVYPKGVSRTPLSPSIPEEFAADYREACIVLQDSPKASAALSRRCLQKLLRQKASIKPSDLFVEIEQVLKSNTLPVQLAEALHVVRAVGNFAVHPDKSSKAGEIFEVEPGEAEWSLDVLEGLFDHYFVQPDLQAKRKAALNAKIKAAGGKPLE